MSTSVNLLEAETCDRSMNYPVLVIKYNDKIVLAAPYSCQEIFDRQDN